MATSTAIVLSPEEASQLEEFLGLVAGGYNGFLTAGLAVGWTPKRIAELMSDQDIAELVNYAVEQKVEYVESKLFGLIEKESFPAIQMFLYCQGAHRGWRPPQQRVAVDHQGKVAVERVAAVTAATLELIERHGPAALAVGGPLDDVVDADIVE